MAKQEKPVPKGVSLAPPTSTKPHWVWACACVALAALLFVAFVDFAPEQSRYVTTEPSEENLVGRFGAETSWVLFYTLGGASWLVPASLVWLGWMLARSGSKAVGSRAAVMLACVLAASGLAAMQDTVFGAERIYNGGPGGIFGFVLYERLMRSVLGVFGSGLILGSVYGVGLLYVLTRDLAGEGSQLAEAFKGWREKLAARFAERRELRRLEQEAKAKLKAERKAAAASAKEETRELSTAKAPAEEDSKTRKVATPRKLDAPAPPVSSAPAATREAPAIAANPPPAAVKPVREKPVAASPAEQAAAATQKLALKIVTPEEDKKATVAPPKKSGDYIFPPLELLKPQVKASPADNQEEHARNAETLLRTLAEFGVDVTLGEIHTGPVITRYELYPAPGVRVEKIANLDKNISLGMRAQSVRILAPVPGKGCVGVEVPNANSTPVGLREILESEDWAQAKAEIPIALGRDVSGRPLISDLTKMPHLLIAGATGSGKSVCINSIIASVLYHSAPSRVRLLMVDPKIVELKIFNPLPHMLIPVVTDPKKVPGALKWLLSEMEKRYQIFAKVGVRNIAGFNHRKKTPEPDPAAEFDKESQDELEGLLGNDDGIVVPDHLPYIVAIIDELADLMMVAQADVETGIARLAQLARAAGIHLVIATQRPSVNVITGIIKANLPSRIAFQVSAKVDSRTILDTGGADQLIGRGDLLFSPPGSSKLIRAQGAYVSDEEVHSIVEFLKKNGPPDYARDVQEQIDRDPDGDDDEGDFDEGDDDEMLPQAIEVLRSTRRASTSMLQRRLRIGYNRAARLMEILEARGIVGPENGSSPREILMDPDNY
jgi:DNA segregation ATPase FtsK/SpoIIIE, S-DNA-T family